MNSLEGRKVLVTGGSRGLGLGIVEAMVARGARVTVVARDADRLAEVSRRLGVDGRRGDVTEESVARELLAEIRPDVVVLNAGLTPPMGAIHEISWEEFRAPWESDVKSGLFWVRHCLRLPLAPGSRVLISSSGASLRGSPMSGGYAGAKRMLWLMAGYANGVAAELGLDIRFQVLVPQQILDTDLGRAAAETYGRRRGLDAEAFLATFGKALPARQVGEYVAAILTDPKYARGVAFGVKGDTGIVSLDEGA